MKKTLIVDSNQEVRKAHLNIISVIKINKTLSFSLSFVFVVTASVFGFTLANNILGSGSEALSTTKYDTAIVSEISDQEVRCLEIEAIDCQVQNYILHVENEAIKEETEALDKTILNTLMTNLENKKLSNRSNTLSSYIQEAQNLLNLSWKLQNFKKTEDYKLIDLSSYEYALNNKLSYIPTLKPIPGSFDGYGWRIHPIFKYKQFHGAADQGASTGTPIHAAASGYVVRSSYDSLSGNCVIINHGNGFVTTYMHCSVLLVHVGQQVSQGNIIAKVGMTGTATGPHLHYAISYNGAPFNPQLIIMQ